MRRLAMDDTDSLSVRWARCGRGSFKDTLVITLLYHMILEPNRAIGGI